ncbi:DAK2 domain-containing protein [Hutsoniella sourekii]
MKLTQLKAEDFQKMVLAGASNLTANVELINSLNVFPVPDGDTGTNMNMSFVSGKDNLLASQANHVGVLAQALAKGLLMGARGNSGVILSQIFRGFSQAIADYKDLEAEQFVAAFVGGVDSAYKAVMKPVEGTILTVAREAGIAAEEALNDTSDIVEIMRRIVQGASDALDSTPDLLPVLKQVGVVDSGGKGLLCIYEGFLASLTGELVASEPEDSSHQGHSHAMFANENEEHPLSMEDITYGYCTEIMVRIGQGPTVKEAFDYDQFRETLNQLGDSLLVVADDEIVKVHVHTEDPGHVMQLGQEFGELIKIKVDNMREQVRDLEKENHTKTNSDHNSSHSLNVSVNKEYAIITVAAGQGMVDLFQSIGVDHVIEGGQTMNPSTQDFVQAIEKADAKQIIILPNNKNIIMAAEQAAEVSDKPCLVIPTTSIPQGINAMVGFQSDLGLEGNKESMTLSSQEVMTGQVTYSIRDSEIDGLVIKEGDYIGLIEGKITNASPTIEETLKTTLESMLNEDSELVTILIGQEGDESLVRLLVDSYEEQYPELEFDSAQTDQPVYPYILAVE